MNLVKNSGIVIVGVVISNILAYVFHFIAGRMLGPEAYGEFGALMALFFIVALPAGSLGTAVTKYTSSFYAESKLRLINQLRKKIQKDVIWISIFLFIIIILFSKIISSYLNLISNLPVIYVGIIMICAFLMPINRGILQGMKKYVIFSWNNIIESFLRLIFLISALYFGFGVNGAILSYGFGYLMAFLLIFPFIPEIKIESEISEKIDYAPIYKFIILVLIVNFGIQSIINIPSLFIKHYYSSEFTGYWTAALNIARISLFISGAIALVMFPEIAGEKEKYIQKIIFNKAAILVFLSSSGIAVVFFLVPELLINSLYGSDFKGAVHILEWMGVAMIFIGLLQLWANYLMAKLR